MKFIKWLGVNVPSTIECSILQADKPIDKSIEILCHHLRTILKECVGCNIPLGINCESVSIYKSEIDGCHELFKQLQSILLDSRNSPWIVQWVDCNIFNSSLLLSSSSQQTLKQQQKRRLLALQNDDGRKHDDDDRRNDALKLLQASLIGAILGGTLVAVGVILGTGGSRSTTTTNTSRQ